MVPIILTWETQALMKLQINLDLLYVREVYIQVDHPIIFKIKEIKKVMMGKSGLEGYN